MMKLKNNLGIIMVIFLMIGALVGCNDVNKGISDSENQIKGIGDSSNAKMNNLQDFTSEDANINAEYVINSLNAKGFNAKKITATPKPYDKLFSVPQELVQLNGGYISIYQYGIKEKQRMQNDYNTINEKGYIVNQNADNWTLNFHLFQKGRVFVVYDGSDINILEALNQILGNQAQ
ncbi:MAG: hypothetical protein ACRC28_16305 [Clostridium sp.]|uniref:hypothetical protein n=1 Tax=Clostridium sp. TaxID=1506 RepID=UPI003F2B6E09